MQRWLFMKNKRFLCYAVAIAAGVVIAMIIIIIYCFRINSINNTNDNDSRNESGQAIDYNSDSGEENTLRNTLRNTQENNDNKQTGNSAEMEFFIKKIDSNVVIYHYKDGEYVFYDYAVLDEGQMQDDLKDTLTVGIYFENEERLYRFLESYSS